MKLHKKRQLAQIKQVLGKNLRMLTAYAGVHKYELSYAAGIGMQAWRAIENATSNPRLDTLYRIADVFGVDVVTLISDDTDVLIVEFAKNMDTMKLKLNLLKNERRK